MSPEDRNGNVLSSWKEIAVYLKCGVRSCVRWEKERGLPIHRMAGPKSGRVFAYRSELDSWLQRQLDNGGEVALERGGKPNSLKRVLLWAVPLAVLAVLTAMAFILARGQKGPKPFRAEAGSIVTAEPDGPGRLRVWSPRKQGVYRNSWEISSSKTNTVRHSSLAAGDFDGDGRTELAVPTYAKSTFTRGEKQAVYFKIFLNFYKQGTKGLWKTTFFSDADCAWEDRIFWPNEVLAANFDNDPASEVILKTATWFAVYDYDRKSRQFAMSNVILSFLPRAQLLLAGVAAASSRNSGPNTIVVSGNETSDSAQPGDRRSGWIFFVEPGEKGPKIVRSIPVDAALAPKALRTGDVDHDGRFEVYSTGVRKGGDRVQPYLFGWNADGEKTIDMPIPDPERIDTTGPALAIADLTFEAGDDILVGLRSNALLLYSWQDGGLVLVKRYSPGTPKVSLNTIVVGSANSEGRRDIVIGGVARSEGQEAPGFYLEVLEFDPRTAEFVPKWKRVSREKDEREIWAAIVAGK